MEINSPNDKKANLNILIFLGDGLYALDYFEE
jgi:hypothetical protein